jgi:hypothetical protein
VEKAVPPVSPFQLVLSNDLLAGLGYGKRLHGQTAGGCIMKVFVAADTHNLMSCVSPPLSEQFSPAVSRAFQLAHLSSFLGFLLERIFSKHNGCPFHSVIQ